MLSTCEKLQESGKSFLSFLSNPVRNVLLNEGNYTINTSVPNRERNTKIHDIGKTTLPTMKKPLQEKLPLSADKYYLQIEITLLE